MSRSSLSPAKVDRILVWRYIFAGLCASLDSIGLARFAFTPLIPELIRNQWFPASAVMYLGAANLAGYVLGALVGRPIASRLANEHVLRLMMVLITAAFFGCAVPLSFSWYFGWRFLSGVAGGVVMVLVAGTILPHVPAARKGTAAGAIFLGLGLGIAGSGTVIPLLLESGLGQTWIGLGIISTVLTAVSWFAWPSSRLTGAVEIRSAKRAHAVRFGRQVRLLYLQYALMAAAAVPPMVFLVDFVARGLDMGTHLGSVFWAIYGLGAIAGPPLYGYLADRAGPRFTVRIVTAVMAVVFAGFHALDHVIALGVLTVIVGTFAPGMVPLVLARVHQELAGHANHQNLAWTRASVISAAGLAAAAYAFSALFNMTDGDHRLLFLLSAGMLLIVLLVDAGARSAHSRRLEDNLT
ncbi:YbfB/YjiJ family MFS transporter [Orrella sp. JC864]|uniref:YbfB/YjiJ family MFS transporter n=1 Tax=Orrella sp. JC864 TaxID=3120298 RepID=UPI003007F4AD